MAWISLSDFRRQYRLGWRQAQRFLDEPGFPAVWISPHRVRIATEPLDGWLAAWAETQKAAAGGTAAAQRARATRRG